MIPFPLIFRLIISSKALGALMLIFILKSFADPIFLIEIDDFCIDFFLEDKS